MRILIVGANGQVGTALQAVYKKDEVIALSHADLDITSAPDLKKVLDQHKPKVVINASGYTRVDDAETHEREAFLINEEGPGLLADAAAQRQIPIIHYSTDYVFDGTSKKPYVESDKTNPMSVYGKSKLAGEKAVMRRNPKHYIIRTSWVYNTHGKNFPRTMMDLAAKQTEVRVVNDQIGCPTYAPHLAVSTAKLLAARLGFGIYHLAGRGETSWHGLASELFKCLGVGISVVPIPTSAMPRPAQRPAYSVLGSEKSTALRLPSWQDGVAEFVQTTRNLRH